MAIKSLFTLVSLLSTLSLLGCSQNQTPLAFDEGIEAIDPVGAVPKTEINRQQVYYISTDHVNVRSAPEVTPTNLVARLMKDDEVEVVDILAGQGKWLKLRVLKSAVPNLNLEMFYYMSSDYLSARRSDYVDPNIPDRATLTAGQPLFVSWAVVNVRTAPKTANENVEGQLFKNDELRLISAAPELGDFVQVEIVKSETVRQPAGKQLFIGLKAVAVNPVAFTSSEIRARQIVVVQNIATEVTRVYEKCDRQANPKCAHKLIFQTRMVVGKTNKERSLEGEAKAFTTWAGNYRLMAWIKFYEDGQKHYPAWFHPDYPPLPEPGSNPLVWMRSKYFPPEYKEATARGAFGWFAGLVTPNSNEQWLHGTYGWGADKDAALKWTRNFVANVVSNPRSSGCTRHDNESIAYLRHIAPVGTQVVRVYALEGYRDVMRKSYESVFQPSQWNYILTKESPRAAGNTIDASRVITDGVPQDQWLEQGTLEVRSFPVAIPRSGFKNVFARQTSDNGDIYRIGKNGFTGYFLVDEGSFVEYQHPAAIDIGGFGERQVPEFLRASDALADKLYFIPKWKPFKNERLNEPKLPKTEEEAKEEAERPT